MMKKRLGGFSLIELLVVIAVIVLIAALIIPAYHAYTLRNATRQAANLLATDLRRAEEEAKRLGVSGTIRGDGGKANMISALGPSGQVIFTDAFSASVVSPSLTTALTTCAGAAALELPDGKALVFTPNGNPISCPAWGPTPNNTIFLTVSDPANNALTVTVDTRTGAVSGP